MRRVLGVAMLMLLASALAGCGGGSDDSGIRTVSAADAGEVLADPPDGLVVLDVRTAEEVAAGHLEGATMIDFHQPGFGDRLAELDRDAPYLLYCRSGNRSGATVPMMEELGFTDVTEVDGGILAWQAEGLPVVFP